MRKAALLAALIPGLALAIPVHQVCDQSGNCAPVSSTDGMTVKLTTQTLNTSWMPAGATSFTCGVTNQAASLLECQALAAGRTYYITDIVAQSSTSTAGTFAIQSGTGTNCGAGTATVFPAPPMTTAARFTAPPITSVPMVVSFTTPLKVTTANAICAIGVATNTLNLQISGYYL